MASDSQGNRSGIEIVVGTIGRGAMQHAMC